MSKPVIDNKCDKCKIKRYGYTDGHHSLYLCFKCGRYEGLSGGDPNFVEKINEEPMILLHMIQSREFTPIS
jgi:hypothetical protein